MIINRFSLTIVENEGVKVILNKYQSNSPLLIITEGALAVNDLNLLIEEKIKQIDWHKDDLKKKHRLIVVQLEPDSMCSSNDTLTKDVIEMVEKYLDKEFLSVDFLAGKMNMSRATLYRRMEQLLGESPSNFIKNYRLKKAALMLESSRFTSAEVARKTGFNTLGYFNKCFQKAFGVLPGAYIRINEA